MIYSGNEHFYGFGALLDFLAGGSLGSWAGMSYLRWQFPGLGQSVIVDPDVLLGGPVGFSMALGNAALVADRYVFVYSDKYNFCLADGVVDQYYDGTGGRPKKVGAPKALVDVLRSAKAGNPDKLYIYWGPSAFSSIQGSPAYLASIQAQLASLPFDGITIVLKTLVQDAESPTSLFDKVFSSQPFSFAAADGLLGQLKLPSNLSHNFLETQLLSLGGKTWTGLAKIDWFNEDEVGVIEQNCRNWSAAGAAWGINGVVIDNEDYHIASPASAINPKLSSWCSYKDQMRADRFGLAQMQQQVFRCAKRWGKALLQGNPAVDVMLPYSPVLSQPGNPWCARPDPAGGTGVYQELLGSFTLGMQDAATTA